MRVCLLLPLLSTFLPHRYVGFRESFYFGHATCVPSRASASGFSPTVSVFYRSRSWQLLSAAVRVRVKHLGWFAVAAFQSTAFSHFVAAVDSIFC